MAVQGHTTLGLMDPFSFRLTTLRETYTFELKVAMTQKQYDFLWARIYRLDKGS